MELVLPDGSGIWGNLEPTSTRYHKMSEELGMIYGTTTYKLLTILKRGEDKMTWGEKVGNNKRAIIK